MTMTLMTAAEMRAYLFEKRAKEAAERAQIEAQGTERRKVWAAEQLAPMLETLMQGAHEESRECDEKRDAAAIDLACSLGYEAGIDFNDEEDGFYAVVKAPELEVATPKMRVHCDEYHAHRESCMVPEKPRTEPGDEDWLNGATGRVRS